MKIGVVQFPGSNCERETKLALLRNGFTPVDCFWHSSAAFLSSLDGFVIVGGFSYEDRVRSGLIAAKDPFMRLLAKEAARGKPLLGICNGAQILIESGLVPGFEDHQVAMALTHNHRMQQANVIGSGFYNDWVYIKTETNDTPIHLPVAHAEGRFLVTPVLYQALQQAGALCYYYCDAKGDIVPEFPINPNGSYHNLAAVSNFGGNVLAMMPHPERTPAGDIIFQHFFLQRFLCTVQKSSRGDSESDFFLWRKPAKKVHSLAGPPPATLHYWVALLIHDNEAISLETTLQAMGLAVSLKKRVHWEVTLPPDTNKISLDAIITSSDELFNRQKECLVTKPDSKLVYFVREREDSQTLSKQNALRKRLHLSDLTLIRKIVWVIDCLPEHIHQVKTVLENQTVLANPLAHDGWLDEN
ncbi:MAG: phosphoribosylformylglycinamidine synthase I [Pseudomonadota bacterium]